MAWTDGFAAEEGSSNDYPSRNPWSSGSESSRGNGHAGQSTSTAAVTSPRIAGKARTPANPLYSSPTPVQSAFEGSAPPDSPEEGLNDITRPSLRRITSGRTSFGYGLHALERLRLSSDKSGSTESISTQDGGQRRSLDELRRLVAQTGSSAGTYSGKGKGKARAVSENGLENGLLPRLEGDETAGRQALLHTVEKGDTLMGIALLYGCTAQAIRTANKLWLNDPIHFRKTLHIPLDACTQPPSRDVEFVQVPGQTSLHLYTHRRAGSHAVASEYGSLDGGRSRASTVTSSSGYTSPYESHRSSMSNDEGEQLGTYLTSTNRDYANGASDYTTQEPATASETGAPSSITACKIIPIVRIPAPARKGTQRTFSSQSTATLKPPETPPLMGLHTPTLSGSLVDADPISIGVSSSTLTPSSSSDRLASMANGDLRIRSKGSQTASKVNSSESKAGRMSPASVGSTVNGKKQLPSARRQASASRPAAASAAQSSPSASTVVNDVFSAGTSVFNSFWKNSQRNWLLEPDAEEMQLARDYRSRTQNGASVTQGSKPLRRGAKIDQKESKRTDVRNVFD